MKKTKKTSKVKISTKKIAGMTLVFRERQWSDVKVDGLAHPKPLPGYKSTLPGAPGWWAKEDPGA